MSQANMRVFEEASEALERGDMDAALRHADENIVWIAARSAVEGAYLGHDGIRKFYADTEENFEVFDVNWRELRDVDDERILAVGTIHLRGRGSTVETDIPVAGIATFERGKIVRWEDFRDRTLALEAAGLRE